MKTNEKDSLSIKSHQTIFLHIVFYLLGHVVAVLYKLIIVAFKAYKYRQLTKVGLNKCTGQPKRILIIHASVGKVSFDSKKLHENAMELLNTVMKLKPSSSVSNIP